jgi:hypothetical protein
MSVATTPIQYPLINGSVYSYSSIEWKLVNGLIFRGFKSINFGRKRDRPPVYGNSPDPLAKVVGKNSYTCDGELYLAEFSNMVTSAGAGYGDLYFTAFVSFNQNGFPVTQVQILGCTLDEVTASFSEGTDALSMKFTLNPLKILWNGLEDLAVPLVSPPQ